MNTETIYRACNLCEAICGLAFEMEDGLVKSIRPDKEDPLSRGHICPKGPEMLSIYNDPDRIKTPLQKIDGQWKEISYEVAFDIITEKLIETQSQYGNDSIGVYQGNPSVHNYGNSLFGYRYFKKLNTKNLYSATSVDQLPHHFVSHFMFGHQLILPVPDLDRTDYFLVMGANPIASKGSMMTAPNIHKRFKELRERNGKLVVIDPRKTETAEEADEHYFIKPDTDAFFLLAFLNILFYEKKINLGKLENHIEGLKEIEQVCKDFIPERVEKITGMKAEFIRKIVNDFTESEKSVLYGRVGLSTQSFGAVCQWLIHVINILTNNFDTEGGAMLTSPAVDLVSGSLEGEAGGFDRWRSTARNLPEFYGEFPVSALADEILAESENRIRFLFTSCGNPSLSTPNGIKMDQALESLDFMVSIDIYMNETTSKADIILPTTCALEHEHYDLLFLGLAIRNTAKFSGPIFKPNGLRHDWEIFNELLRRYESKKTGKPLKPMSTRINPESTLDYLLRAGTYGKSHGLNLQMLKDHPHGIDFGPLVSRMPERLKTDNKKIHLAPEILLADIPRLIEKETILQKTNFVLIGRRHLKSNNSWMHNLPKLMNGNSRCTAWIHPTDAKKIGLMDGGKISIRSKVGAVIALTEITDKIMEGVISLPHGFGHTKKGTGMKIAEENAGVSLNELTDEFRLDSLCGNAAFSGIEIELALA